MKRSSLGAKKKKTRKNGREPAHTCCLPKTGDWTTPSYQKAPHPRAWEEPLKRPGLCSGWHQLPRSQAGPLPTNCSPRSESGPCLRSSPLEEGHLSSTEAAHLSGKATFKKALLIPPPRGPGLTSLFAGSTEAAGILFTKPLM